MKIAIVGDPHISMGFRSRTDDYLHTVLNKITRIADANDVVIFLGDVFDASSMPTYVFNETYKALRPYQNKLLTILGNHDLFHRNLKALNKTTIGSLNLVGALSIMTSPFIIDGYTFVPVMTDTELDDIPEAKSDKEVLLCHKYFEMALCPEESLTQQELEVLQYKYVFMGHDHQYYQPVAMGQCRLYRPGSLTRTTTDLYNKDREILYYVLDTQTGEIEKVVLDVEPSEKVFLPNSFVKKDDKKKDLTNTLSISKLLAKFDKQQLSNLSLEETLRKLGGTEEQVAYIRELHRLHNIKYN